MSQNGLKQQVLQAVDTLPEEALKELMVFLEYLQYKLGRFPPQRTPYRPVALGGLWAGVTIPGEVISERREMWGDAGKRDQWANT